MEEKRGGAAARQLCVNSNTRVRQDMHAHGKRELRCRHTITEAGKSGKKKRKKKKSRLPLPPPVSEVWSVRWIGIEPSN